MGRLVVAVSGTSGAGKSSLVQTVAQRLDERGVSVGTVHADDFTDESALPRGDVAGWLARGGQPGEWPADTLERHLRELVEAPSGQGVSVVLVEEPFGRARPGVGDLVQRSVHLEVPLHVALARRLLRQFVPPSGAMDEASTTDLRRYLDRYLVEGADLYRVVDAAAAAGADVVLDASLDPGVLAEQTLALVAHWRSAPAS